MIVGPRQRAAQPVSALVCVAETVVRAEASPELDHLCADAACDGATSSREYSAGVLTWRPSVTIVAFSITRIQDSCDGLRLTLPMAAGDRVVVLPGCGTERIPTHFRLG